jgi:hypothetical protein
VPRLDRDELGADQPHRGLAAEARADAGGEIRVGGTEVHAGLDRL